MDLGSQKSCKLSNLVICTNCDLDLTTEFFASSVAVKCMAVVSRLNRMELGGILQPLKFNLFSGKGVKKKTIKPLGYISIGPKLGLPWEFLLLFIFASPGI